MLVLKIILCILFGYLVGNINPAYNVYINILFRKI